MSNSKHPTKRGIVSFVLRGGRMNKSQRKAWNTYREKFVINLPHGDSPTSLAAGATINWEEVFGRKASLICEIGSGSGDSLVPMAAIRPEIDFIAFEVYQPAIASTLRRIGEAGLTNIRIVPFDAVQGFNQLIEDDTLSEIWIFFPDPWHKNKHHKRRLINQGFARTLAAKLAPKGRLRLATDWEEYAQWMRTQLDESELLTNQYQGWAPRYKYRPITKFEAKGLAKQHLVRDLTYIKSKS